MDGVPEAKGALSQEQVAQFHKDGASLELVASA